MLGTFWFTSCATRVHEEQRGFGRHGNRIDNFPAIVRKQFVDEEISTFYHGSLGRILTWITPPDQDFIYLDALIMSRVHCLVGFGLVIDQPSIAVVAINRHKYATA